MLLLKVAVNASQTLISVLQALYVIDTRIEKDNNGAHIHFLIMGHYEEKEGNFFPIIFPHY